jgi:hypothetical protein
MKTTLLSFIIAFCTLGMVAQSETNTVEVTIGDSYIIGPSETASYQHIEIPRFNIIMKRGGFPNPSELKGRMVEVTAIKEKKDNTTVVTIKMKDGTRFFGSHRTLKAHLKAAVAAGELVAP